MHSTVLLALLLGTLAFMAVECSDWPEVIGDQFIEKFKAAVADRDEAKISDLVDKNFFFAECHHERNREYLINYLKTLPQNSKFSITLKNAKEQAKVNVRIEVHLEGLFGMSDAAIFISNKEGTWKMIFFKENNCE